MNLRAGASILVVLQNIWTFLLLAHWAGLIWYISFLHPPHPFLPYVAHPFPPYLRIYFLFRYNLAIRPLQRRFDDEATLLGVTDEPWLWLDGEGGAYEGEPSQIHTYPFPFICHTPFGPHLTGCIFYEGAISYVI